MRSQLESSRRIDKDTKGMQSRRSIDLTGLVGVCRDIDRFPYGRMNDNTDSKIAHRRSKTEAREERKQKGKE